MRVLTNVWILSMLLVGCTSIPAMSPEARKIQVHAKPGPLVEKCKTIGPVIVEGSSLAGAETAFEIAKVKARDEVVRIGGDTLAITNDELDSRSVTPTIRLQGTAMQCY